MEHYSSKEYYFVTFKTSFFGTRHMVANKQPAPRLIIWLFQNSQHIMQWHTKKIMQKSKYTPNKVNKSKEETEVHNTTVKYSKIWEKKSITLLKYP